MEKQVYQPPVVMVVEFKMERGFIGTGNSESTVGVQMFEVFRSSEENYSTGERFTEYTTDEGAFAPGGWH